MGLADVLLKTRIPYDSDQAIGFVGHLMSKIEQYSIETTILLAEEKGAFPAFSDSIYTDGPPRRNSQVNSIAPTGTLSIFGDCSPSAEPIFSYCTTRTIMDGTDFVFVNEELEKVCKQYKVGKRRYTKFLETGNVDELDLPDDVRKIFVDANEIDYKWHIQMQSTIQQHVDMAVSKSVNLPNSATKDDISEAYQFAWKAGVKGVTVFRDGCRDTQVMSKGTSKNIGGPQQKQVLSNERYSRDSVLNGQTHKVKTVSCNNLYVTTNKNENGELVEVLCTLGKAGECQTSFLEWGARLTSLALQHGVDPREIIKHSKGIRCPYTTLSKRGSITSCADGVAKCMEDALSETVEVKKIASDPTMKCKICGGKLVPSGGACYTCESCGGSTCGG